MLVALGYYERWVSGVGAENMHMRIRRFRCRWCGRSVSVLPDFAQPYRLIRTAVIQASFDGRGNQAGVPQRRDLLACYWRRFIAWLPDLRRMLGRDFGRAPPSAQPREWWSFITAIAGDFARVTRRLVAEARITIFGKYRCHQPSDVHTPI